MSSNQIEIGEDETKGYCGDEVYIRAPGGLPLVDDLDGCTLGSITDIYRARRVFQKYEETNDESLFMLINWEGLLATISFAELEFIERIWLTNYSHLKDKNGDTMLIHAIKKFDIDRIFMILGKTKHCMLYETDSDGNTALMLLCDKLRFESCDEPYLGREREEDECKLNIEKCRMALHAIDGMIEEIILDILDLGADICNTSHANDKGKTLLMCATEKGRKKITEKLMDMGADGCAIGAMDDLNETAFSYCRYSANWKLPLIILEKFGDECNPHHIIKGHALNEMLLWGITMNVPELSIKLVEMKSFMKYPHYDENYPDMCLVSYTVSYRQEEVGVALLENEAVCETLGNVVGGTTVASEAAGWYDGKIFKKMFEKCPEKLRLGMKNDEGEIAVLKELENFDSDGAMLKKVKAYLGVE